MLGARKVTTCHDRQRGVLARLWLWLRYAGSCLVENGGEEDVQDHRDDDGGDQPGLVSPDVLGLSWAAVTPTVLLRRRVRAVRVPRS